MIQMDATVIGPLIHFGVKLGLGYARNRYVSNEGKPCGRLGFKMNAWPLGHIWA